MVLSKEEIDYAKNIVGIENISHSTLPLQKKLTELKAKEPNSDKPFFRLAIIGYELCKTFGSIEHSIVYVGRFKNNPELFKQEIKNAQLEIGDCMVQLILLCKTYDLDIWKCLEMGVQHLEERHEDFKIKGWTEI